MTKTQSIKVGVLGTGRIGKIHIKNLINHPNIILKAIADPFIDEGFAKSFKLDFYKNKDAILKDKEIDAVFICTPSDTHYELIKACIAAKKAVFCEKPVDLDLNRILEIKALIEQENAFLQVGFNRRFDSNFKHLAGLVEKNELGQILQVHIISRDFSPPPKAYVESSGGMFLDMSIHDFDMLRFLSKSEVKEIFVNAKNLVTDYKELDIDTATINLTLANGALAVIENCREAVYGYDQRAEVFGKKGRAFCENKYENSVTFCNKQNQSRQNPLDFFLKRYADSYKSELDDFVSSFLNRKKPSVGIEESIEATIIALGAMKSFKTKKLVELEKLRKEYNLGV